MTEKGARRRRSRRRARTARVVAVGFASIVLAAGAAYGVYRVVTNFQEESGPLITDAPARPGSAGPSGASTEGTPATSTAATAAPLVVGEDVAEAMLERMTGAGLQLTVGRRTRSLGPESIAVYIEWASWTAAGVTFAYPHISASRVAPLLDEIAGDLETPAVDAGFGSDSELRSAWVIPAAEGKAIDAEQTAQAMTAAATRTTRRTVEIVLATIEPDLTTAGAEAMGIRDLLATYQTEYFTTPERAQSVMMPAQYASNVLVAPGEEYNLDEQIGPRTAERGFVQAIGVTNPGEYEDVLGGALTQVATTLFNAALLAGLEITERHNHSIYIDHYPLGLDATVTASSKNPKNLRFKNNTDHYILIQGWSDGGHTRFSIYGTDDGRRSTMVATGFYDVVPCTLEPEMRSDSSLGVGTTEIAFPGQSAMKCLVTRTITWPSGSTTTDTFLSTWGTLRQVIKVGTSTTTSTVSTTTTTTAP